MGRYVDELKAATLESLHPTEAIPTAVQMELPSTILPHSALSPKTAAVRAFSWVAEWVAGGGGA